ncbi:MAG: glucosaminidase domain-containing protein [Bacteroidetes bacterium]|nr:glucosaminidase domain-containing protein [Bacteroidota bacterium]
MSFFLLCTGVYAQPPKKKTTTKKAQSAFYKTSQLDKVLVKQYMDSIGIRNSDIVLRQALYETGYFKHKAGMQKNNIFGFRHSKSYMRFKSWRACVDYYKKWQDKNYLDSTEDYYKFLERIKYARSPVYIAHLKKVKV